MPETVKRGYVPTDEKEFSPASTVLLRQVQQDICYLINRGYDLERSVTFVCNRFGLSARQRMALIRSTATRDEIENRVKKEIGRDLKNKIIYIDGFNLIITLEIALSGTTLLRCMDGTIRDLAGLHGTYRLIDKTDMAIDLVFRQLEKLEVAKAIFYLDSPVSNSGRLKQRLIELSEPSAFETEVILLPCVDKTLYGMENVVTSDGVILDNCISWVNLSRVVIGERFPDYPYVNLCGNT